MNYLPNPWRGSGLPDTENLVAGSVVDDPSLVMDLLGLCPIYKPTPMRSPAALAYQLGVSEIHFKDERGRMGLGSFKALGAAYAIAKQAYLQVGDRLKDPNIAKTALAGKTFVTASAGNHGLSVAAGARLFGAKAVVYLAQTVPAAFQDQLQGYDAQVVIEGENYEQSMAAATGVAAEKGWILLSDSTWDGCLSGRDVMEGYLALAVEAVAQLDSPPSHIFLQAGVGGFAASLTAYFRLKWQNGPTIIVVEPEAAPALMDSIRAGKFVASNGPVSEMGRLDCKEASHLALRTLAELADGFMTLDDRYVRQAIASLDGHGLQTSSSGGAGYAGLCAAKEAQIAKLDADSRVLIILSEGPTDG